jgi:membrane-associated phospholipid phosphatase
VNELFATNLPGGKVGVPWGKISILSLLLLALAGRGVEAQERSFPYSIGATDFAVPPLSLGLALLGESLVEANRSITRAEIGLLDRSDVNGFDRYSTGVWSSRWDDRSSLFRNALVGGSLILTLAEGATAVRRDEPGQAVAVGMMFAQTYSVLLGITHLTKGLTRRMRPYVYNTALSVDERFQLASSDEGEAFASFYSGHSAAAFAAATFISTVVTDIHGPSTMSRAVWGSTFAVAGVTALARVKSGEHFPTDVIAGAVVGSAVGYLVPALHRGSRTDRVSVALTPSAVVLRMSF